MSTGVKEYTIFPLSSGVFTGTVNDLMSSMHNVVALSDSRERKAIGEVIVTDHAVSMPSLY